MLPLLSQYTCINIPEHIEVYIKTVNSILTTDMILSSPNLTTTYNANQEKESKTLTTWMEKTKVNQTKHKMIIINRKKTQNTNVRLIT